MIAIGANHRRLNDERMIPLYNEDEKRAQTPSQGKGEEEELPFIIIIF